MLSKDCSNEKHWQKEGDIIISSLLLRMKDVYIHILSLICDSKHNCHNSVNVLHKDGCIFRQDASSLSLSINLQHPGEHANCGNGLVNGEFSYFVYDFSYGITSIINLQQPGEHASCGNGLVNGEFSYNPQDFMDNDGRKNSIVFSWQKCYISCNASNEKAKGSVYIF